MCWLFLFFNSVSQRSSFLQFIWFLFSFLAVVVVLLWIAHSLWQNYLLNSAHPSLSLFPYLCRAHVVRLRKNDDTMWQKMKPKKYKKQRNKRQSETVMTAKWCYYNTKSIFTHSFKQINASLCSLTHSFGQMRFNQHANHVWLYYHLLSALCVLFSVSSRFTVLHRRTRRTIFFFDFIRFFLGFFLRFSFTWICRDSISIFFIAVSCVLLQAREKNANTKLSQLLRIITEFERQQHEKNTSKKLNGFSSSNRLRLKHDFVF